MRSTSFELLMNYAKKPDIFEKSTEPFWDDEHISKGMLDSHLNPNTDAASRKHGFIEDSVNWIVKISQVSKGQKILDLGCGPGLYAEKLSELGYKVTGIDFSKRSIDYAKKQALNKGLDISYYYQDYLTMDFENEFDLIIMIYCDFGVLADEQRDLLLKKIYKSLKPGGKFIFDTFTPKQYAEVKEGNRTWELNEYGGFWNENAYICLNTHYTFPEHETYLNQIIVLDETEDIQVYRVWDHTYTNKSITKLINSSGFNLIGVFSDVKGTDYSESTNTIGVVVEKQEGS